MLRDRPRRTPQKPYRKLNEVRRNILRIPKNSNRTKNMNSPEFRFKFHTLKPKPMLKSQHHQHPRPRSEGPVLPLAQLKRLNGAQATIASQGWVEEPKLSIPRSLPSTSITNLSMSDPAVRRKETSKKHDFTGI